MDTLAPQHRKESLQGSPWEPEVLGDNVADAGKHGDTAVLNLHNPVAPEQGERKLRGVLGEARCLSEAKRVPEAQGGAGTDVGGEVRP